MNDIERDFQQMLEARAPDDAFMTAREKRLLKQPTIRGEPHNIFDTHLSQHTIFENETDRKLIRKGTFLRPVGLTPGARLSEAQIAAEEARLGIRLPDPWREVYTHFNGGWAGYLYWGDLNDPRHTDPTGIIHSGQEALALEDVAPLRDLMEREMTGYDWQRLDPRLIAIACRDTEAMILDYRDGDDPKVCRALFSPYADDPLDGWEQNDFTQWWPNMRVFFRGLYVQHRHI